MANSFVYKQKQHSFKMIILWCQSLNSIVLLYFNTKIRRTLFRCILNLIHCHSIGKQSRKNFKWLFKFQKYATKYYLSCKNVYENSSNYWYKSWIVFTFDIKHQWTYNKETYQQIKLIQASKTTVEFHQYEVHFHFSFDCNGYNYHGKMYGKISSCWDRRR